MEFIIYLIIAIIGYFMFTKFCRLFTYELMKPMNVRLPKKKNYYNKKTPIYRVSDEKSPYHHVEKWYLDYYIDEDFTHIAHVFLPIPVIFYSYGYVKHEFKPFIFEIKKGGDFNDKIGEMDIKKYYETKYNEELSIKKDENTLEKKYHSLIDHLNHEFNENYE